MVFDNTFVKIDLDAISHNFDAVCNRAGKAVMAVVKADAYGHGAVQIARLLENKCAYFGLASITEALQLRHAGITTPLLVLGNMPEEAFGAAIQNDIRVTVYRYESALALSQEAQKQGKTACLHLAIDTGMSRLGFQVSEESADACAAIANLPGLCIEGLFSHLATADCADLARTHAQSAAFAKFDAMLKNRGLEIPLRHLDNSAGVINFGSQYEMVRAGIVIYGMYPSDEVDKSKLSLQPALQWISRITHLQTLPAGREISYGGTFITQRPTVVATIPVGYADGYRRALSNKFYVLIHGKRAPILGRVCMDQMMVDVTDIPETQLYDPVVLIGQSGDEKITMEEISAAAGSFNYEFVCGIHHRRIPRIYYQGGHAIESECWLPDHE